MNYEINEYTQLLLPISQGFTKIIEDGNEYRCEVKPLKVVEHSCEYFGSSLDGRKLGTKSLTGITHKPPVIIEESRKLIFFPTTAPNRDDCIWINLSQVDKYFKVNSRQSAVKFKNGDVIELQTSIGSLTNQILRATRLKMVLDDRMDKKR